MAVKKLKVGLVLDDGLDSTDGVQQYVLAVGGWLSRQGHEVHYLVGQTERQDITNLHSLSRNMSTRFNRNRGSTPLPASARAIKKLLKEVQFDVLHVQVPYSPFMAARVISRTDKRTAVVGTFHVLPHSGFVAFATRLLGIWLKSSLKRFDKMLAVSTAAADYAHQTFRVKADVLPNVISYPTFHDAKPLPQYKDTFNIVFLGRLVPRKGCLTLLKAITELNRRGKIPPQTRGIVCGKGPLEADLKKYVKDAGLENLVEFKGHISEEDKPRYYASSDITVFPSSGGESFGIVLLEGMASGNAVVLAGDNPGYSSVMQPQPDLLFPPLDVQALANKIEHFMNDNNSRQTLAKWGEEYTKQFDIDAIGKKLIKIYEEALRTKR